ncbi:MAG: hypothetical protein R2761_29960 [Acidimicrobiales bacterium]
MTTTTANGTAAPNVTLDTDQTVTETPIRLTRHRLDVILTAVGALTTVVLLVAGALLTWGSSFAGDYVTRELKAQNISFPDQATLEQQGRDDLVQYAGAQVTTGDQAEAYASFIAGHVAAVADGATYADLGGPERAAKAAVTEAAANGAPADEIAGLQTKADTISEQRETIFRGEMLRGALLNTYAWDTVGRIAGLAAIAAFITGAVMALLTVAGALHTKR